MKIKREITFIYQDSAEKNQFEPIAEEAQKRGFQIKWSMDKLQKCEIGFYCQHVNFPQYSKFSIIMLHDIIQQYSNWPNLWLREPWNKYDIGILPSKQWVDNWNQCSQWYYTRPKYGMFEVGWPKADAINQIQKLSSKNEFYEKYGLDIHKPTILYAPSWENDGKQDDFVKSMMKLDVNIMVKQWDANPLLFPQTVNNIKEMYDLHKKNPRVTLLPPSMNIFEAIAVSDILVSEESSTMCEAAMMKIPSVSVSDWLIPDVTPSRYPKCDYDFVVKTTKNQLTNCIKEILDNYSKYKDDIGSFADKNFSNIGITSSIIMDVVEDILDNKESRYMALIPHPNKSVPLRDEWFRMKGKIRKDLIYNYSVKYKIIYFALDIFRKIKHQVIGNN